ncbi:MAG: Asp/Glu racemase [Rhodobacteraceae bacterium]|jgi:maleate isomerase|nr:Asp/Glu racemase [Paracoccaceae bacterium]
MEISKLTGFPFEVEKNNSKKLGLVVLQADETIENELRKIIPHHCDIYHSRIPSAPEVTPKTLKKMMKDLPNSIELFPSEISLDVIGYACTSGATIIGPDKVKSIINKRYEGMKVTDPISSVCEALKVLEVKKIGFVSPYVESVSTEMRGFLVGHGFDVKSLISFEQGSESVVASIGESDTLKAVVAAATHDVEAIFVSCTNLKTFSILDQAEAIIGKPVLSSNQVLAWSMLRKAQVCMSKVELTKCPGIIFDKKFF